MKPLIKILIVLLVISDNGFAQGVTPNIGFEMGSFVNWECYTGNINPYGVITVSGSGVVYNRHTLYGPESIGVKDPYGNFPVLCPNGGKYSIRLGNDQTNAEAERVTYTFDVPPGTDYSLILNYAVVFQNPNHPPIEQPKFTAQIYDVTDGYYANCPSFDFVASSGLPGFKLSNVRTATSVYYKEWATATIDLRYYSGKTLRLEFTTNDCTQKGHFGYAYLDINDNADAAITGNSYCIGQKSVTLYGPPGFATYDWYNADLSKHLSSGQTLRMTPPPPDMSKYSLIVTPFYGLGCIDTLHTTVNKIDEGFKLAVQDTVFGCPGSQVDLTLPSVTIGSSSGMTYSYYTDSLATTYLYSPSAIDSSGVVYIQGINHEGCQAVLPVNVVFRKPSITIKQPVPVRFPVTVDLSATFKAVKGLTYGYYSDAAATQPLSNFNAIQFAGTYYLKATNDQGCDSIAPINVLITPPPPYKITAANAFTPNNDGVNDYFKLDITGYAVFESLKIYNRYGQEVFTGKSIEDYWDGIFNGHNLPGGSYYWVFRGVDNYHNVKITTSGNINLLR